MLSMEFLHTHVHIHGRAHTHTQGHTHARTDTHTLTTLKNGVRKATDAATSGVVKFEKPPNIPLSVAGTACNVIMTSSITCPHLTLMPLFNLSKY